MKKLKWIHSCPSALIVGCGFAVHLTFNTAVNTNIIFIREITFSDKLLLLSGDFSSSAMDYKGYSLRYDNHKLYVKIKGSVFALGKREGASDSQLILNNTGQSRKSICRMIPASGKYGPNKEETAIAVPMWRS